MAIKRAFIWASDVLMDRVSKHVKFSDDSLTDFITRALLNQLEKEGDYDIRTLVEGDLSGYENKEY